MAMDTRDVPIITPSTNANQLALEEQEKLKKEEDKANIVTAIANQRRKIRETQLELENQNKNVRDYKAKVDRNKEMGVTSSAETIYAVLLKGVDEIQIRLSDQQNQLSDLESQLANLQK